MRKNYIAFGNAMLNYYMHIPKPEKVSDEEWAYKLKALAELRKTD